MMSICIGDCDHDQQNESVGGGIKLLPWITILIGLSIWSIISILCNDSLISPYENRNLVQYTVPERETFLSGIWMQEYEDYSCDQIAGRQWLLEKYYSFLNCVGVKERNSYVIGNDGYIFAVKDDIPYAEADYPEVYKRSGNTFVDTMDKWKPIVEEAGSKLIVLEIPHQAEFCAEYYPMYWENGEGAEKIQNDITISKLRERSIDIVPTWDMLKEHKEEDLYYKTDHHYACLGAYYVYQKLLAYINETYDEDLYFPEYTECEQHISEKRMIGSSLIKLGDSGEDYGDCLKWFIPRDMPEYERYESEERSDIPLIKSENNNYTIFMGGDSANTVIKTNRPELPNILYIGRSYSNALEVMSVYSFNEMHSIDQRYYEGNLSNYIQEHDIDYVISLRFDLIEGHTGANCTIF